MRTQPHQWQGDVRRIGRNVVMQGLPRGIAVQQLVTQHAEKNNMEDFNQIVDYLDEVIEERQRLQTSLDRIPKETLKPLKPKPFYLSRRAA